MECTGLLRQKMGKVKLHKDTHAELHHNIPGLPPLSPHVACRTLSEFRGQGDALERAQQLISAIGVSILHPMTHQIEKDTGLLVIRGLDAQLPYLEMEIK